MSTLVGTLGRTGVTVTVNSGLTTTPARPEIRMHPPQHTSGRILATLSSGPSYTTSLDSTLDHSDWQPADEFAGPMSCPNQIWEVRHGDTPT